ncbi:hypothetical protein AB0D40_39560 [Streptomyces massasporeus]|uniref:hypothetical protein n=1 Tax=Streptomyces massasporeus TaxID=67324 RepID=UPI0033E7C61E
MQEYTKEAKETYLELAQELGHPRAMRELGYPKSWNTANKWAKESGVEVTLDELKSRAAAHRDWYGDYEHMEALQSIIDRSLELTERTADISADDLKKVADALTKAIDKQRVIQGKTTNRTTTEEASPDGDLLSGLYKALESNDHNPAGQREPSA